MTDVFTAACEEKGRQKENATVSERRPRGRYIIAAGKLCDGSGLQIERYSIMRNSWETLITIPRMGTSVIHHIDNRLYLIEEKYISSSDDSSSSDSNSSFDDCSFSEGNKVQSQCSPSLYFSERQEC